MIQSIMHPGMTDGEASQVMRALRARIETSLGKTGIETRAEVDIDNGNSSLPEKN